MLNLSSIKSFSLFPRDPHDPRGSFCSTPDSSLLIARRLPQLDRLVRARGSERLAVWRKRNRINYIFMTFEQSQKPTRSHIPQPDRSVITCRGQRTAIGRECDCPDNAFVAFERGKVLTRGYVP